MKLRVGSVCSGICAPEVAWRDLGWEFVFRSEIEPFPNAVAQHHFPNVPNLGDMTKFQEWPDYAIDVLVGGTPCQSFSVAGLRAGLADPRGNLALTFLAIAARYRPRWLVWENVPGVHSSWSDEAARVATGACGEMEQRARQLALAAGIDTATIAGCGGFEEADQTSDFDCFLAGMEELGYGIATCVLDAQYFGVAQRRERVFVVGHIGGQWQRAAAVLFESACLSGNPAPRREPRERPAPTISARTEGGGGLGTDFDLDGGVIPIQEIGKRQSGTPMNGVGHCAAGDPMFTLQSTAVHGVCATLTKNYATHHGRTAGNNGGVAENQLIPCGINGGEVGFALRADASHSGDKGDGGMNTTLVAYPLTAGMGASAARMPHEQGALVPEIAGCVATRESMSLDAESTTMIPTHVGCLNGVSGHAVPGNSIQDTDKLLVHKMAVRRLTPRECERLQGFPDDYTLIEWNGKPREQCPDGPRYKALGNSMAVPVLDWIGRRIELVEAL